MASYNHFIPANTAPSGARDIGVFRDGKKVGRIPLGSLKPPDRSKRLYSFGVLSDMHVGEAPYSDPVPEKYYGNFIAALEFLGSDPDVSFIVNCGDLIVFETDSSLLEPLFAKYAELVAAHAQGKPVFAVSGNHEALYETIRHGDGIKSYPMAELMQQYASCKGVDNQFWDGSKARAFYVVERGNDVFIFLNCYRFITGKTQIVIEKSGLTFASTDTECTITADPGYVWPCDPEKNELRPSHTVFISGCTAVTDANKMLVIKSIDENVLRFPAGSFSASSTGTVESGTVRIERKETPPCQVYPTEGKDIEVFAPLQDGTLRDIHDLFQAKRAEGKRLFVLHHVHLDENSHKDYDLDTDPPSNMFYLSRTVFEDCTVFTGHTHFPFSEQENGAYRVLKGNYHSINSLVHIPSVYDHGQGYIVDVYEDGIHLRGKNFSTGEDVALGTYLVNTK